MRYMFARCTSLEGMPSMPSTAAVESFSGFVRDTGITSFTFQDVDTSAATSFHSFFQDCDSLASIIFTGVAGDSVTDVRYMFDGCSLLADPNWLPLSWGNITSLQGTFRNCATLTSIDMTDYNMINADITSLRDTFDGCTNVSTIDLFGIDAQFVSTMSSAFANCTFLTSVNDLDIINIDAVTTMAGLFTGSNAWSEAEYDAVLQAWEARLLTPVNIGVDFGDAKYSAGSVAARDSLINTHTWSILDGGPA